METNLHKLSIFNLRVNIDIGFANPIVRNQRGHSNFELIKSHGSILRNSKEISPPKLQNVSRNMPKWCVRCAQCGWPSLSVSNASSQTASLNNRKTKMTRSFRRMLANGNPKRSNFNKLWPIHSQQVDRRCSYIRESNNNNSADGPIEVIKPAIAMRMKQAGFQSPVSDSD